MKFFRIDGNKIVDVNTFHYEFKTVLDFPDYYGMNMDAWIDCMSSIHESVCVELVGTLGLNKRLPKLVSDLIECTAIVNQRFSNHNESINLLVKYLE